MGAGTQSHGDRRAGVSPGAVSKIWTRLEGRKLIERGKRHGRTASIVLKREDGSGEDYTRPTGRGGDTFFKLPHAFWLDGWHEKLDLPATAMLLIALSRLDGFSLPYEKAKDWYGVSRDSAKDGFMPYVKMAFYRLRSPTSKLRAAP
ncbi:MAG: hypothetical protein ACRDYA_00135 [Egibacteraceae bacterium]